MNPPKPAADMPENIYAEEGDDTLHMRLWYKTKGMGTHYIRADLASRPAEIPTGAIENGREYFRRLSEHYDFQDSGGHKINNCYEFEQLKLFFETLVEHIRIVP